MILYKIVNTNIIKIIYFFIYILNYFMKKKNGLQLNLQKEFLSKVKFTYKKKVNFKSMD